MGSDDGATRLPEEYKELEKVLCTECDEDVCLFDSIGANRKLMLPRKS